MFLQRDHALLFLVLYSTGSLLGAMAKTISWTDPQLLMDQSQVLHNSINDEIWHDSMETPDNHIYSTLSKSKVQMVPEKGSWSESPDNVKRWLNHHFKAINLKAKNDFTDNELFGQNTQLQQAKRNSGGYMCHFKLCQLGASNSGKRLWSPSASD